MECGRKRKCNRRNCRPLSPICEDSPNQSRFNGFLSGLCNFLILSALMAVIYLMLEHHCTTCKTKCDMKCITKSIDDITKNMSSLKNGYQDLEIQISKLSHDLPKLHGQLEVLESLANTLEMSEFGWNPKNHFTLPNVDVYLAKMGCNGRNISHLMKPVSQCPNGMCHNSSGPNIIPNIIIPNRKCLNSISPNNRQQ